jgi:DNA-binding response OmpR family regulator
MKKTILVIDNERPMLELARMILERAGYRVLDAVNGEDGLEKAMALRPDLILIDFMMPVLNGIDTFQQLVQNPAYREIRDTPVIMLTARSADEPHRKELLAMGLAAYLVKPFGHRELVNVIDNVFLSHELKIENRRLQEELHDSFHETVNLLINLLAIATRHPNTLADGSFTCRASVPQAADQWRRSVPHQTGALLHDIGRSGFRKRSCPRPKA